MTQKRPIRHRARVRSCMHSGRVKTRTGYGRQRGRSVTLCGGCKKVSAPSCAKFTAVGERSAGFPPP